VRGLASAGGCRACWARSPAEAAIFAAVFTLVALPSCLPWLALGAALQRYLRTARARRIFHGAMAALLAASTVLLVGTHV
jgi:threonine/homoserine/homoserine lactone efflux protein